MSCDFELKMVVRYIDRWLLYAEANRKQKVSKQRKLNSLQDGYLGFSKCLDFDPQNFKKNKFFWKKCSKNQNFQNLQKPYYMHRTHMRVVRMPNFKFVSQFLTTKWLISVKYGDVIKINHIFGPFIDIVHKNKLHRWIPEMNLNQKSTFYFQNFEFWKLTFFDPFWPFWPDLEVKSENYGYHWILRLKLPI